MTTLRPPHPVAALTPSPKPVIPPKIISLSSTNSDSSLLFRQKLVYITTHLNLNPQKALLLNPSFRSSPLSSLLAVQSCLSSMGLHVSSISRILDMHPSLLTADPHLHLYPILDFLLHETLIPFPLISTSLTRCPRLLVSDVTSQLRPALHYLTYNLQFKRITPHNTVLLVSSVEKTLKPKVDYLMGLGFRHEEVVNMVVRAPALLTISVERNYMLKVEYLVGEMGRDVREVRGFPQFFSFSLEGRIKPRYRMLVEYGFEGMPLREMLSVSDGEFNDMVFEMRLDRSKTVVM